MTTTTHQVLNADARNLSEIKSESVDLVVTSPPYPMIEMWDDLFCKDNHKINLALQCGDGNTAFELMHQELDKAWCECHRILKDGSFACINIGDATRTINERFQLYPNHARIINSMTAIGFDTLPVIIWKKTTNAPNKFMGSGMLPSGAYVTLEHEYILIFRKGSKRIFKNESDKLKRAESAFFWEERNTWFSDTWDIKGVRQKFDKTESRERNAAFPMELAYRLINMYSVTGEVVFDPFAGTGTTSIAAVASARNSIANEIDKGLSNSILQNILQSQDLCNKRCFDRLSNHIEFIKKRLDDKKEVKHMNEFHTTPVITRQECMLQVPSVSSITQSSSTTITASHETTKSTSIYTPTPTSNNELKQEILPI